MSTPALHGWVFAASIRGPVRIDDALTAQEALADLGHARVDGAVAGPAFPDARAAADWLERRAIELSSSPREVGGWVFPHTPFVLLCAGAPLRDDLRPRRVSDLGAYLTSPECLGFCLVAPPVRQRGWLARIGVVGAAFVVGLIGAGMAAWVSRRDSAPENVTPKSASVAVSLTHDAGAKPDSTVKPATTSTASAPDAGSAAAPNSDLSKTDEASSPGATASATTKPKPAKPPPKGPAKLGDSKPAAPVTSTAPIATTSASDAGAKSTP